MTDEFVGQARARLGEMDSPKLRFVEGEEGSSFGNAVAVFEGGTLRLRVVRDRGQVFADFGSTVDSTEWFDSRVVASLLETEVDANVGGSDIQLALSGIARFAQDHDGQLEHRFSGAQYQNTKKKLEEIQRNSALNQLGIPDP